MRRRRPHPTWALCECGNRRRCSAAACDRCLFLDGSGYSATAYVIAELRRAGGVATHADLRAAIGARSPRTIYRALASLERAGRVRRLIVEEAVDVPIHVGFGGRTRGCRCLVTYARFELVEARP